MSMSSFAPEKPTAFESAHSSHCLVFCAALDDSTHIAYRLCGVSRPNNEDYNWESRQKELYLVLDSFDGEVDSSRSPPMIFQARYLATYPSPRLFENQVWRLRIGYFWHGCFLRDWKAGLVFESSGSIWGQSWQDYYQHLTETLFKKTSCAGSANTLSTRRKLTKSVNGPQSQQPPR